MATTVQIMFPVGRYVSGSLYDLNTKDDKNQPMPENKHHWSFGYAIKKGAEQDWRQTSWGQQIAAVCATDWPNGESRHPSFSFKIKDGDSNVSTRVNTKAPNQHEGWPGHWILFFRRGKQIGEVPMVNADGSPNFSLRAQKSVKKGDYIQVFGSCKGSNDRPQNAGCYLNDEVVAFAGKGEEIVNKDRPSSDPSKLGFGGALPAGAVAPAGTPAAAATAPVQTAVVPHTAFLTPGVPAAAPSAPPARVMAAKAGGLTYEQFLAHDPKWTDDLLRANGYMV